MKYKNAQAAMEMLVTYGWVFLIVIIIISALFYFGVLNVNQYVPERCMFGNSFECSGYKIDYGGDDGLDGQVKFQLFNKAGEDIIVDTIDVTTESSQPYLCNFTINTSIWHDREYRDFESSQNCSSQNARFKKGGKGKVNIRMTYHKVGADSFKHTSDGEIFANLE